MKEHNPYNEYIDNKTTDHFVMNAQSSKRSKDFKIITTFEWETVFEQNLQDEINNILKKLAQHPNHLVDKTQEIEEDTDEWVDRFADEFIHQTNGIGYT